MAIDRAHLVQHLELAAQAYGADLALPVPLPLSPAPAAAAAPVAGPPPAAPAAAAPAQRVPMPPPPPSAAPAPPVRPTVKAAPPAAEPLPRRDDADRAAALHALQSEVLPCTRCKLHRERIHTVFGEGDPHARVMFVGEAPGSVEDQTGRPFVGPAGKLLDRILAGAMGLQRSQVYITNINKCRPPGIGEPEADEVAACLPFLQQQTHIVRPEVIVCLGRTAAQNLLGTNASMAALRGRELQFQGIPVVVTWHPSTLLREPAHKGETWDDIKRVNRLLGLPEVPPPASA